MITSSNLKIEPPLKIALKKALKLRHNLPPPVNQTVVLTWKEVAIIKFIKQLALEAKDTQIEQRKIDFTNMGPIWLKFV